MSDAMVIHHDRGLLAMGTWRAVRRRLAEALWDTEPHQRGTWQKLDVKESPAHQVHELLNVTLWLPMAGTVAGAQCDFQPDLPWAEGHFQERVAGRPVNPGAWHDQWPYHAGRVDLHQNGGKYDHNYMERFWARGLVWGTSYPPEGRLPAHGGYRFSVGDLGSVVELLVSEPLTRQAYLPVWFPEDTGSQENQRVPCSLGYHFQVTAEGELDVTYHIRSMEAYRHMTNDLYMATRLGQWVAEQVSHHTGFDPWTMGQLTVQAANLHVFKGDAHRLEEWL